MARGADGLVVSPSGPRAPEPPPGPRDDRLAVQAAQRRPMAQRLALALAWNELASELRAAMKRAAVRRP